MSWSAVPVFNVGDILTAANMNIIGGDINLLGGTKGASDGGSTDSSGATSYTTLAHDPAVTVTTLTTALVILTGNVNSPTSTALILSSFVVTVASSIASSDARASEVPQNTGGAPDQRSTVIFQTGLTAGSNTFTMQHRVTGGSAVAYVNRSLSVIPLSA